MGNVLSGDEKLPHLFSSYDKKSRGIVWIDEHFGYRPANKSQRKAFDRRRTLYYDGNKERVSRQRSHSLGAIIGDLYACKELGGSYQDLNVETSRKFSRSFLPRIKLVKSMPIKEDFHYSSNQDMYNCSEGKLSIGDIPTTSYREQIILLEKEDAERRLPRARSYRENEMDCEMIDKPEENYFTKNFDECMKRLQIIEKEQEIMEKDGERTLNAYNCKTPTKRQMIPTEGNVPVPPPEPEKFLQFQDSGKKDTGGLSEAALIAKEKEEVAQSETLKEEDTSKILESRQCDKLLSSDSPQAGITAGWYSNLKKQFETENEDAKAKEASCRVTGATLKSPTASAHTSDSEGREVRHYFSRLVRSNKSLIDEELPDPDKVQNIRAMFQESLNSTLEKNFNKRFGGSLQNINVRPREDQFARPKSAQGNRNDFAAEFRKTGKENSETPSNGTGIYLTRPNPYKGTVKVISIGKGNPIDEEKFKDPDTGTIKPVNKKFLHTKWTDTTSLSSGVSSDLSSYDTDAECCSREVEQNTTDEESQDDDDKHYVQNETLEKIRSFGTSVTYFGGQMITCSVGPLLSPTTQAILEEIGEKYPDRKNFTRTFEEFYKKYTENNEPRLKKVGRTRSFGQSDVFYKPNILNNTEIEMYKNDLEMEIGIRKPSGKVQSTLKQKLVKSNSVGSRLEFFEQEVVDKLNEILDTTVELSTAMDKQKNNTGSDKSRKTEIPEETSEIEEFRENAEEQVGQVSQDVCKPGEQDKETKSKASEETAPNNLQTATQSSQLLFGYEKNIFNRERKPDMDFEEFEVCETVEEKLEKIDENPQSYRLTIQVNQDVAEESDTLEEIIINDQEPLDSLEIYLKTRKAEDNSFQAVPWLSNAQQTAEEHKNINDESSASSSGHALCPNERCHSMLKIPETKGEEGPERHFFTKIYTSSKWPIETTVMVDIQKNEENTPKLVTANKSTVKTKTRSFRK